MEAHDRVAISKFTTGIRIVVPDVPDALITYYLRNILQKFCEETQCWQEQVGEIYVTSPIDSYEIDAGDAEVISIKSVKNDDVELVKRDSPDGEPYWWWMNQPSVITIGELDKLDGQALNLIGSLKPSDTATTVAASLYKDHRLAIEQGTLSMLYRMPKKTWTDPALAGVAERTFQVAMDEARLRVGRGFSTQPDPYKPKTRKFY